MVTIENCDRETRVIDEHRVCGFACHRVTVIVEYQTEPVVYSGPDPMSVFYDHVMNEIKIIGEILKNHKDMLRSQTAEQAFLAASICVCVSVCPQKISKTTSRKLMYLGRNMPHGER